MDQGRMGVARLGSLSVDAMALAARDNSNRQSPRVCIPLNGPIALLLYMILFWLSSIQV
jgi:hypothetical protein